MDIFGLRNSIADYIGFSVDNKDGCFKVASTRHETGYRRDFIYYINDEGKEIPAYLLVPDGEGPFPAVLVNHQHNGERHLGKSEICGLCGDPNQAFGPVLASSGVIVLAPDSICFEDRRKNMTGTMSDGEADWLQHYNEMCYRLVNGDTLARRVLQDAMLGISLLASHPLVDRNRIGTLGHSYGGNTVLFHAALDERIKFACASGSACTYKNMMQNNTGIEMARVIPGFCLKYDTDDVVKCIAPRSLLIVSAKEDKFTKDANFIEQQARPVYEQNHASSRLEHKSYAGGHALDEDRFEFIVDWIMKRCKLPGDQYDKLLFN